MNMHTARGEDAIGQTVLRPSVAGRSKDELPRKFDCIFFTGVQEGGDGPRYVWYTTPDETRPIAKVRYPAHMGRPFAPVIEQDFGPVLAFYESIDWKPKILILGDAGTGKSRALSTLP